MVTLRRLAAVFAFLAATFTGPALAAGTPAQPTWHAEQAKIAAAREAGAGGVDVLVAVLDSWVDGAHPDFEGRVLPGADCLQATCRSGPASSDACDHGTHVAGTVAASSFGVAPRARILPVRVLAFDPGSRQCVGRPDDVAAGIRWAVANGARIVNLSLGPDVPGLSTTSSVPRAVEEAAKAGVVVVFSAGNATAPVTDTYAASAIIVAATGPNGELASYSQRGAGVDLAAPGGDPTTPDVCAPQDCVTSLFPGGRYAVAAGTSMAAPHVSGVAALLIAQDPTRTRGQVLDRLLGTAIPMPGAGRGRLDAQAALAAAPAPVAPAPAPAAPPPAPAPPAAAGAPQPPPAADPAAPAPPPAEPPAPAPGAEVPAAPLPEAPAPPEGEIPPQALPLPPEQDVAVPAWAAILASVLVVGTGTATALVARR